MYSGKYRLLLFLAICQILKVYGSLKTSYLSLIASFHKTMLVSSGNRSSKSSRPLGLFFFYFNPFTNAKYEHITEKWPLSSAIGSDYNVDWLNANINALNFQMCSFQLTSPFGVLEKRFPQQEVVSLSERYSVMVSTFIPIPLTRDASYTFLHLGEYLDDVTQAEPTLLHDDFTWPREPQQNPGNA